MSVGSAREWRISKSPQYGITRDLVLATIAIFVFVKKPEDVLIYTFINSSASFLGNLTMWAYIKKTIKFIPFSALHCFKHTQYIFQLFIPVIAVQIYTVLDKTMLGLFVNTTEVGYYAQADKIVQMLTTVISSLTTVLLPRIAALNKSSGIKEVRILLCRSLNFIFELALPMCIGCILVIDQFVPVFFGQSYGPVTNIIRVQSILFIVVNIGRLLGTTLVAVGQQKKYTIAVIFAAILNFSLNSLFLIELHKGAIGVSIASVMAEFFAAILQMFFIKELVTVKMIFKSLFNYCFPTIIMGMLILGLRYIIGTGFFQMIIEISLGGCIYVLILLVKKDDLVYKIFDKIVHRRS